jgi:hypothetical protein
MRATVIARHERKGNLVGVSAIHRDPQRADGIWSDAQRAIPFPNAALTRVEKGRLRSQLSLGVRPGCHPARPLEPRRQPAWQSAWQGHLAKGVLIPAGNAAHQPVGAAEMRFSMAAAIADGRMYAENARRRNMPARDGSSSHYAAVCGSISAIIGLRVSSESELHTLAR